MKKRLFVLLVFVGIMLVCPKEVLAMEAKINDVEYDTLTNAYNASVDGDTIVLTNNVVLPSRLIVRKKITIDLNGFNIERSNNVLGVLGSLKLVGNGTVRETSPNGAAVLLQGANDINVTDSAYLYVGKDVVLEAWSPIMIQQRSGTNYAYGVKVDVEGTLNPKFDGSSEGYGIYVNGTVQDKVNYPIINVKDGAVINGSEDGLGVYLAGYTDTTFGNATITGGTGIGIKAGKLTLNGTKIITNGASAPTQLGSSGIYIVGSAIQMESNPGYDGDIELTINGGEYRSANASAIVEYGADENSETLVKSINITDGVFSSKEGLNDIAASNDFNETFKGFITSGSYSLIPDSYINENYEKVSQDGKYVIRPISENVVDEKNPPTNDNIINSIVLVIISVAITSLVIIIPKRRTN